MAIASQRTRSPTAQEVDTTTRSVQQISPGIFVIPVPLDDHSIGHANVYALVDDTAGIVLVDSGWDSPTCQRALDDGLREIGHSPDVVRLVVVTHSHADHCGGAGRFQDAGARIAMHPVEASHLGPRYGNHPMMLATTTRWLDTMGVPSDARDASIEHVRAAARKVGDLTVDLLIHDDDVIDHGAFRLQACHSPGHTQGHLCFLEKHHRVLFTGDAMFPRINYSANARPLGSDDPIRDHLATLGRLRSVGADRALPGHQEVFSDPAERARILAAHQNQRRRQVLDLLEDGQATAWTLAAQLERALDWTDIRLPARVSAAAEVLAHLKHLSIEGLVVADGERPARWRLSPTVGSATAEPTS